MLLSNEKLLFVKLFQVVISARVSALSDDYKIEVPNINTRYWQAPLRESVYQSIARHRVYRGENLDERQEYDRMLWGKIRIARFMKRLDVAEANEGLRTGVLVHGKRGDFEFRQTDHSIYDCVGRKCRSDNILLAVWRVQQMNEPYTLYISVKVPNYLYHFEPTEDIYLYTVEKGLKRLRYQQYSAKKSTGKLIYDPYPFVSSRFTTHSTTSYPMATLTTALEVTATSNIPAVTEAVNTYNADGESSQLNLERDTYNPPDKVNDFTLQYSQKPELTTIVPLTTDLAQTSLSDNIKGSGIRRTFNTFLDTNPYWQLDLLSPPSQYRNFSDDGKRMNENNYDTFRDSIFTVNQPKEILITPKPFKPSQQIFTYSEPDPLFSNTGGTKPRYTTERPVVILNPTEAQTTGQKEDVNEINPPRAALSEVKNINIGSANTVKSETSKLKTFDSREKKTRGKLASRRGGSNFKTVTQIKKRARIRNDKNKRDKDSNITKLEDPKSLSPTESNKSDLKSQYLSPTTYHPKLNLLVSSESRQFYTHFLPAKDDHTANGSEMQPRNVEITVKTPYRPKSGKIKKRQEDEGYFANGHTGYDDGGTDHPYEYETTYQTNLGEYPDYEKWDENVQNYNPSTEFQVDYTNYFNETQEFQNFYSTGGYEGSEFTTFADYTEAITDSPWTESANTELPLEGRANRRLESENQRAIVKANVTDRITLGLGSNTTKDAVEILNKDSTEKSNSSTASKFEINNTLPEKTEKMSTAPTEKINVQERLGGDKEEERREDEFENGRELLKEGKNSTVSMIVTRLTKSVTEKRYDGTAEVRKRNAPVFRKKILKKKLQDLKSDKYRNFE